MIIEPPRTQPRPPNHVPPSPAGKDVLPSGPPRADLPKPVGPLIRRSPGPAKVPANLDRLFLYQRGQLNWDQMTGFRGGPRREGHQLILWSFMAMLIDSLILLSMSCFFLVSFALIMRSPFGEIFRVFLTMGKAQIFGLVFLSSAWLYLTTLRIFFGFSIGEWACDLRLGQPTDRMKTSYPVRVFLRSTLIVGTGLILFPLLSLLVGRDLAGKISGIQLISLR